MPPQRRDRISAESPRATPNGRVLASPATGTYSRRESPGYAQRAGACLPPTGTYSRGNSPVAGGCLHLYHTALPTNADGPTSRMCASKCPLWGPLSAPYVPACSVTRCRTRRTKAYDMSIRLRYLFHGFHRPGCTPDSRNVYYHTTSLPERILFVHP